MTETTTIQISVSNKNKLVTMGNLNDTYDSIISNIIDSHITDTNDIKNAENRIKTIQDQVFKEILKNYGTHGLKHGSPYPKDVITDAIFYLVFHEKQQLEYIKMIVSLINEILDRKIKGEDYSDMKRELSRLSYKLDLRDNFYEGKSILKRYVDTIKTEFTDIKLEFCYDSKNKPKT